MGQALAAFAIFKTEDKCECDEIKEACYTIKAGLSIAIAAKKEGNLAKAMQFCDKVFSESIDLLKDNENARNDLLNNLAPVFNQILDLYISVGEFKTAANACKMVLRAAAASGMEDNNAIVALYLKVETIFVILSLADKNSKGLHSRLKKCMEKLENKLQAETTEGIQNVEGMETMGSTKALLVKAMMLRSLTFLFKMNIDESVSLMQRSLEISELYFLLNFYEVFFVIYGFMTVVYSQKDEMMKTLEQHIIYNSSKK